MTKQRIQGLLAKIEGYPDDDQIWTEDAQALTVGELKKLLNLAKVLVERRAAELGVAPFDSPSRTKRYTRDLGGPLREINAAEWKRYEWYNVTSVSDPSDGHVYVIIGLI